MSSLCSLYHPLWFSRVSINGPINLLVFRIEIVIFDFLSLSLHGPFISLILPGSQAAFPSFPVVRWMPSGWRKWAEGCLIPSRLGIKGSTQPSMLSLFLYRLALCGAKMYPVEDHVDCVGATRWKCPGSLNDCVDQAPPFTHIALWCEWKINLYWVKPLRFFVIAVSLFRLIHQFRSPIKAIFMMSLLVSFSCVCGLFWSCCCCPNL